MEIFHRITIIGKPGRREILEALQIPYIESPLPRSTLYHFDISESSPLWTQIRELTFKCNTEDGLTVDHLGIANTVFTDEERDQASHLGMFADWLHGYPEPSWDGSYVNVTYDTKDYCEKCGIGGVQNAPFRMKKEPKWAKRKDFLQLNWVFDQFFIRPEVWEKVFKPLGIGCRPVLHYRAKTELSTVVQLEITHTSPVPLVFKEEHRIEMCAVCHRKKYLPIQRGFWPSPAAAPPYPICRSQEFFGSGGQAYNLIIVTQAFAQIFRRHQLRGVAFCPLKT